MRLHMLMSCLLFGPSPTPLSYKQGQKLRLAVELLEAVQNCDQVKDLFGHRQEWLKCR
jgi:hypothetical protein